MTNLRRRPPHEGNGDAKEPDVGKDDPNKSLKHADSPRYSYTRQIILLALLCSSVLYLAYPSAPKQLSMSYALCSPDGLRIYTVDDSNTQVQCLVVHKAQIVDTGSLEDVQRRWRSFPFGIQDSTSFWGISRTELPIRFLDPGAIVVPGLSDSHAHILEYGASRTMPLEDAKTIQDAVKAVRNYILGNPDVYTDTSKFIEGWGWDHTSWPVEQWPTAADLDSDPVIRGRSVVLQSKDGHALWISSRVINDSQPLPEIIEGGVILRDSFGNPTGVVLDNAQDLIKRMPLTDDVLSKRFSTTLKDALAAGLTSIHDAGFNPVSLEFFKRQVQKAKLPIRIYGMAHFDESGEYWGDKVTPLIGEGEGTLSVRSVKMFADGALRSGGAALYMPYADNPGTSGFMRLTPEVLNTIIPRFLHDGWQVNVHAIGDRANGLVLDAFENALKGINVTALRPRLEHAQIMTKSDMERLGQMGVIASIQPTHVISDMWYAQDRLGPERVKELYAFRTLLDSGARVTFGSDAPVENLNPLSGFHAAITRVSPHGQSPHGPDGWFPTQCLTRIEALRGMTIEPAYASFTELSLGSIIPGKQADYVVLSQDIMTIPVNQILDTKVIATVIDGKPLYGNI